MIARSMGPFGRLKSSPSSPRVTMFLASVVPADSFASSMKGTGTHRTSETGPRSISSRGVSSVAS